MRTNLLYISPDFNYACGVSKHVYINLKNLSKHSSYKLFFITNKGDSLDRLENIPELNYSIFKFEKDHINILRIIVDVFKLYVFCKKNKIKIIHTHHRYPELLAVIVSKLTKIKTVTTVHSFVKGMKSISFRSNKIISVSKSVEEHLFLNYPHTKCRCTTIYNCVDESLFKLNQINISEFKKSFGYSESDKILFFAGRISIIKGIDILIEAFKRLPYKLDAKLLIIGSVTDTQVKVFLDKNDDKIKILAPQKDITSYYQLADLVILPSREDPFPYVMIETGAMKKTLIGSKTGGISEFIEDGVNGVLVEAGNCNELAEQINFILDNPGRSKELAAALNQKVKEKCNCEKYFESLILIYNQMLE